VGRGARGCRPAPRSPRPRAKSAQRPAPPSKICAQRPAPPSKICALCPAPPSKICALRPAHPSKICAPRPTPQSAPAQMGELGHPAAGPRPTRWHPAQLSRTAGCAAGRPGGRPGPAATVRAASSAILTAGPLQQVPRRPGRGPAQAPLCFPRGPSGSSVDDGLLRSRTVSGSWLESSTTSSIIIAGFSF
jgi:hypothetical protein